MNHVRKIPDHRGLDRTGSRGSASSTDLAEDEFDRGYDIDASVPHREKLLARVEALNSWARHGLSAELGVRYGATPAQRLDVFHGTAGGPVIVFLHGGYWTSNSAEDFSFVALGLAGAGATVVVTNYALCPAVTIGEITRQHGAAVAWTIRHAADFGADPNRVAVVGHSAGGHGAAMLASTNWTGEHGLDADAVKGYCAVSGLFDLRPLARTKRGPRLRLTAESAPAISPTLHPPAAAAPMLVTFGLDQTGAFIGQSRDFAAAWRAAGLPVRTWARPRRNHYDELLDLIYTDGELTTQVLGLTEGRLAS